MRKVLILMGSPRRNGNTAKLAAAFARGAKDGGAAVTEIVLREKTIGDCRGCSACRSSGGRCVQRDDMREVYAALEENDVIVLASPVYFYTWTSLMKRVIDRTFAVEPHLRNKAFYLLATGAASEESGMETMLDSFRQYAACFCAGGNRIGGYLLACGTRAPDDITSLPVMERAYALGSAAQRENRI